MLLEATDVSELIKTIGPRVKFRAKLKQLLASKTASKENIGEFVTLKYIESPKNNTAPNKE